MKTMKTLTALLIMLIISVSTTFAQTQIGVKTGLVFNTANVSGLVGDILPETTTTMGYNIGVFADIPMNAAFSFHPELALTTKGFRMGQGTDFELLGINIPIGVIAETSMKYIETTAMLRYKVGSDKVKAFIEAGPGVGIASSAYIQPKATLLLEFNLPKIDINLSDDLYSRTDYSANIGTGVEFNTGNGIISANLRYTHGLSNVLNDPLINTQVNNRSFTMGVAYGYQF